CRFDFDSGEVLHSGVRARRSSRMGSFELQYDADDDALEITFSVFDERFVRTLPLNDHIVIFADLGLETAWGITFYSFSRLLGVSETEFTSLRELPEEQIDAIM